MPDRDMKAVLVRLTPIEHALLQSILKADGTHLQHFFRQAARKRIQQHALATTAGEADEDR